LEVSDGTQGRSQVGVPESHTRGAISNRAQQAASDGLAFSGVFFQMENADLARHLLLQFLQTLEGRVGTTVINE
jgi:hypothetical protein